MLKNVDAILNKSPLKWVWLHDEICLTFCCCLCALNTNDYSNKRGEVHFRNSSRGGEFKRPVLKYRLKYDERK